ncbi:MAG: hypothetical protein RLN62_05560 [Rickettsiales bacterium]
MTIYIPIPTGTTSTCNYPDIYVNNKTQFSTEIVNTNSYINLNCKSSSNSTVMYELAKNGDVQTFNNLIQNPKVKMDYNFVPEILGASTPLAVAVKSQKHKFIQNLVEIDCNHHKCNDDHTKLSIITDPGYSCVTRDGNNVAYNAVVAAYDTTSTEILLTDLYGYENWCFLCGIEPKENIYENNECEYINSFADGDSSVHTDISLLAGALVITTLILLEN